MAKAKTLSESSAWEAMLGFLEQAGQSRTVGQRNLELDRARALAVDMLRQVRSGIHENPPLIIWPNPPAGRTVAVTLDELHSPRVYQVRYKHHEDGRDYKHAMDNGVNMWDGLVGGKRVLLLERPDGRRLWADY